LGFSNSWIAVQGLTPEAVLEELRLEVVSEGNTYPEGEVNLAKLANGWMVVWFERDCEAAFKPPAVNLARHGPAVACAVEDHVMFSEARGYAAGVEAWRVTHDCEEEDRHLATSGDVPAAYATIRASALKEQDKDENEDVDLIWDVPPNLAKSICGFRHDEHLPDGATFVELRRVKGSGGGQRGGGEAPTGGGFWKRLFGGR